MKPMKLVACALAVMSALVACTKDATGPADKNSITVQAGDGQFVTRNATLSEPLQVIVTDPTSKRPRSGVKVDWRITEGSGASLTQTSSTTDNKGIASTQLRVGDQLGTYRVEATTEKIVGSPARFSARAVDVPAITTIAPTATRAGDTVTINGSNFSPTADENIVTFGGFRARVTSATATQMRAVVPVCVPTRNVQVQAALGAVASNQINVSVTGNVLTVLQLARGEGRTISSAAEFACLRAQGGISNYSLLLMPQNFSQVTNSFTAIQLAGLTGTGVNAVRTTDESFARTFVEDWEFGLRRRESQLLRAAGGILRPQASSTLAACATAPQVGSRCDFEVINKDNQFEKVTAEVKAITTRAIVLQDIEAPATGSLTSADFQALGAVFDDPIYATDVATFGSPSDIDNNGKVLILLTPVVNELTDRGASGFIAGFFYGCDLLSKSSCSGSNRAEMFYALTADPGGQHSDARTRDAVMRALPPVLAHEFQHMINFARRGSTTDALWLSEGMAHHAEDVVGTVFENRGDTQNANTFKQQNYTRGNRYLRATNATSLIGEEEIGTLELRGAAWLFVKYLADRFGNDILQRITGSTQTGVANVVTQAGRPWSELLADWGIALYVDDAPEVAGVTVDPKYKFSSINLRQKLANANSAYPLQPTSYNFQDFVHRTTIEASAQTYVTVSAGTNSPSLSFTFGGAFGGNFSSSASPQITVFRLR